MKVTFTKKGFWGETQTIFEIDDDEIMNILKQILLELRDDQVQRLILTQKLDEVNKEARKNE